MLEADLALQRMISQTGAAPLMQTLEQACPFKGTHEFETGIVAVRTLVEFGMTPLRASIEALGTVMHDIGAGQTEEMVTSTNSRKVFSVAEREAYNIKHTVVGERAAILTLEGETPAQKEAILKAGFTIRNHHSDTRTLWLVATGPSPRALLAHAALLTQGIDVMHSVSDPNRPYPITDHQDRHVVVGTRTVEEARGIVDEQYRRAGVSSLYGMPIAEVVQAIAHHLEDLRAQKAA